MGLGDVRNPRTDQKHGSLRLGKSVEIQRERRWEAAYGVCPGTAGVAGASVRRVARYSSQQRRKSLERGFWNAEFGKRQREPAFRLEILGVLPTEADSPNRDLDL